MKIRGLVAAAFVCFGLVGVGQAVAPCVGTNCRAATIAAVRCVGGNCRFADSAFVTGCSGSNCRSETLLAADVHYEGGGGTADSRLNNGVLTVERVDSYWAPSRWSAAVSDLQLEIVRVRGEGNWWRLTLQCRNGETCVSFTGGPLTSSPNLGTDLTPGRGSSLLVDCNSQKDCADFLDALTAGRVASVAVEARSRR